MKKLALLLAALGVMSAVTYAEQPTLKVTSIGQEIEIEDEHGGPNIGDTLFTTTVNLSYDNWTFGVTGGKRWNLDTDEVDGTGHRLQLDAMRKMNDNYSLGLRWRSEKNYDRYYARGAWNYGMFWGAADIWYQEESGDAGSNNSTKNDRWRGEIFPIGIQYKWLRVGYFIDWTKMINPNEGHLDDSFQHQLRFYAPLYKGDKLTLSTEWRLTVHDDVNYKGTPDSSYVEYEDFGRNRVYLKANYKVNESFDVYGSYAYEFRDREVSRTGKDREGSDHYSDIILGWKYKF